MYVCMYGFENLSFSQYNTFNHLFQIILLKRDLFKNLETDTFTNTFTNTNDHPKVIVN